MEKNQVQDVKNLLRLRDGPSLCYKNSDGDIPLHLAVENNKIKSVKLLVAKSLGAMLIRNNLGFTPMFLALKKGFKEIVDCFFLNVGKDWPDNPQYPCRSYYNFCNCLLNGTESIESSIQKQGDEFDVDFKNLQGVESPLLIAVLINKYHEVEMLIKAGADVNYRKNNFGVSALHIAAMENNPAMMNCLLDNNANVDCIVNEKKLLTPLHYAVKNQGKILAKLLLERGASVNLEIVGNKQHSSALHEAVKNQNLASCEILFDYDADINQKNEDGNTALFLAVLNKNVEIVKLLLERKADTEIRYSLGYRI